MRLMGMYNNEIIDLGNYEDYYLFISVGIANNSKVYELIDKIYSEDKYKYYSLAKNSKLYNHELIMQNTLIIEEYAKKVLGILYDENARKNLSCVIKKGWNKIYIWARSADMLNLNEGILLYVKKRNNFLFFSETISYLGAIILEAINQGKVIDINDIYSQYYFNWLSQILDVYLDEQKNKITLEKSLKAEAKRIRNKLKRYFDFNELSNPKYLEENDITNPIKQQISTIFISEGLNPCFASNSLNEDDILYIIANYISFYGKNYEIENGKDVEDIIKHILYSSSMIKLLREYKNVKKQYFTKNNETMLLELEDIKNKLKRIEEENKTLKEKNRFLELENKNLQSKLNSQLLEVRREHNRIIKKKDKEIEKMKLINNELNKKINVLDEIIESLNKENERYFKKDLIERLKLDKKKGVIIGGHENWQKNIRKILPNFKFIGGYQENFDTKILSEAEIIIFNTSYTSHAVYYKFKQTIKNANKKVIYVNSKGFSGSLMEINNKLAC